MNTTRLKIFAPEARRKLMEQVERKLDHVFTAQTPDLSAQRSLVESLRKAVEAEGKAPVIERVAYVWFNRFAALRYLDAKGWHPFHARVLTPVKADETQPELLRQVRGGTVPNELQDWCDPKRIADLLAGGIPSASPQAEVQRLLIVGVCQFYAFLLPDVFERVDDFHRLLLPDDLLTEHSVPHAFQTEINDADCAEVEILGWLYQFYIAEKKDAVMARKGAVPTADVPAVTQLFTPHWIVRYLVENSLGRLWLLNRPGSRIRERMPYYIEGEVEDDFLKIKKPEEIRLLDPAVGSGHMLTYAFDLLYLIYEEEGYPPSEIPGLILRHNLRGLEICPRAAQLAELALVFKAREKSRRFFQTDRLVRPRIFVLRDVCFAEGELRDYVAELGSGELFDKPMVQLLHQFEQASSFGSLIQPCLDEQNIAFARRRIEAKDIRSQLFLVETHSKVLRALEQAEALAERYNIVIANPPYMGLQNLHAELKGFLQRAYEDFKSDLFAAFVVRIIQLLRPNGFAGMMTPFTWMFIKTYEPLRKKLLTESSIRSLIRPEYHSFFDSAFVPICAFVIQAKVDDAPATYIDLGSFNGSENQSEKALEAISEGSCRWRYLVRASALQQIPGTPIAYWASEKIFSLFAEKEPLANHAEARQGLITGNNEKFLRRWWEVSASSIEFPASRKQSVESSKRWFPYNKGGDFRKWYGNQEFVVLWEDNGAAIKNYKNGDGKLLSRPQNTQFYFHESVSWSDVTAHINSFRWFPEGYIFDATGHSAFPINVSKEQLLSYLNTKFAQVCANILNPTMHFHVGYFRLLPAAHLSDSVVSQLVQAAIGIARADWDGFERSWDFSTLPLLRIGGKQAPLETTLGNWLARCAEEVDRLKELEQENNRLLIEAHGLQKQLTADVPIEEIALTINPAFRYGLGKTQTEYLERCRGDLVKELLSYAMGCIMGRYSLDRPGVLIGSAGESLREFAEKVGRPFEALTFVPNDNGIVPMLDGDWFEDDVLGQIREFLRVAFGEQTLGQNVAFLEDTLGKDLRRYFLTDFYKDHIQTYKKRPVYWLFQSPQKQFRALVYLHRYTRDTVNTLLNGYLREFHHKLSARIRDFQHTLESESVQPRDKTRAQKELDKVQKAQADIELYEREILLPLAQKRLEIDLDNGVKANYPKFGLALAPIAGITDEED
jgi:hypothetical protein